MLIRLSMVALGAQLTVAMADDLPRFDIQRNCRLDTAAAAGLAVAEG